MKSFWSGAGTLAQHKVLLAILGVAIALAGFETWKWQQEQHDKSVAQQQRVCKQALNMASGYVHHSRTLFSLMLRKLGTNPLLADQPGINRPFEAGQHYILFYQSPHSLIPDQPRYDGKLFTTLSGHWKSSPPPLMVTAKSLEGKQALVTSRCTPEPFAVSLENLYDTAQHSDFKVFFP